MTSHYREPFNLIRRFARLIFRAYFTISVFDDTYGPCFEVKDEEDLLLEKTPALACVAGGVVWVRD